MSARRSSARPPPRIPPAAPSAPRSPRRRHHALLVAALLLAHFLLGVSSAATKSVTYDELAHLTRGYSYFRTGDYRLGPPHPPLAHYWAALPLLGMDLRFPSLDQPAWRQSNVWNIGRQFFFSPRLHNDADAMLWRGRAMIVLLSTALGAIVYAWSRQIFGPTGGLLSLALYAFCPTLLAHGSLVTTDLAAAFFFTAATYSLWRLTCRLSVGTFAASAASVAGLFLAKGSGVLLAGMGLVLIAVRVITAAPLVVTLGRGRNAPRVVSTRMGRAGVLLAVAGCIAVVTAASLWALYGFRWSPFRGGASTVDGYERDALARKYDYFSATPPPDGQSAWTWQLRGLGNKGAVCKFLHEWRLLPDAYVYGFLAMLQSARGRDAFFNGERSLYGWHTFFPYAFLVKTPLPLFGMLAAAAAAALLRRRRAALIPDDANAPGPPHSRQPDRQSAAASPPAPCQMIPLWVLLGVYAAATLNSTLNIGHRHLLPMYPALLILCGAAAYWRLARRPPLRLIPVALAVLFVLASLTTYPHFLAYFNWIAGGPRNGYKHLVDSSLDWGQDLKLLARRLQRDGLDRTGARPVYLQYFGMDSPEYRRIAARPIFRRLPADGRGDLRLRGGRYCISATLFQQVYVLSHQDHAALGLRRPDGRPMLSVEWSEHHERIYQNLLPAIREFEALPDDAAQRLEFLQRWRPGDYAAAYERFTKLRFMRLCAHLRKREPNDMVGYSILLFDLSDTDVDRMVNGPPP